MQVKRVITLISQMLKRKNLLRHTAIGPKSFNENSATDVLAAARAMRPNGAAIQFSLMAVLT